MKLENAALNHTRIAALLCVLLLSDCTMTQPITPSRQGNDHPGITLTNFLVGDGTVDKPSVSTIPSCTANGGCAFPVFVTRFTRIMLSGQAIDSVAGIQSFSVVVTQNGQMLFSQTYNGALDSNGQTTAQFGFIGSDGGHGFGVAKTIEFVAGSIVEVVAKATNFEGNTNLLDVVYTPLDPVTASISAKSPINRGESSLLTFSGSPASNNIFTPPVNVSVTGTYVSPLVDTTYSLQVVQPFPGPVANFPNPPPTPGQTTHPTSVVVSTTVKVIQPPTPLPNPATMTFYLYQQQTTPTDENPVVNAAWANIFGFGAQGAVVSIKNDNTFGIELVGVGHSTADCFGGTSATVPLGPNQATTSPQLAQLYGGATGFPVAIVACALAGATIPSVLVLSVTYSHP